MRTYCWVYVQLSKLICRLSSWSIFFLWLSYYLTAKHTEEATQRPKDSSVLCVKPLCDLRGLKMQNGLGATTKWYHLSQPWHDSPVNYQNDLVICCSFTNLCTIAAFCRKAYFPLFILPSRFSLFKIPCINTSLLTKVLHFCK